MNLPRLASITAAVLVLLATGLRAENMIGPQSQNEGIEALPLPGKITIDGNLDDWDWSGRIWVIPHINVRSKYSVEVAAMYDKEALYLGFKWKDPTPMFSAIDPEFNPGDGWRADAAQLNVQTDRSMWAFLWYYTARQQPCMRFGYWNELGNYRKGQTVKLLTAQPGGTDLGEGARMAYQKLPDGDGYTQEARIPWALLWNNVPDIKPGLVFHMGMELLWGDVTGKAAPTLRYADNMAPGVTSREFFWAGPKPWGKVELMAKGHVETRKYVSEGTRLQGTIPIRFDIPQKAERFTVVIEDADGGRVRNLAGDFDALEYQVAEHDDQRTVEIKWDGLDDHGAIVEPGKYRVRGLCHNGIDARYEMTFYNPGTPPWRTADGSGAWGSDHSAPYRLARSGDWMIAAWGFAEGGDGIIGIAPDGRKKWGEKRGARYITADDSYLYAVPVSWHTKFDSLIRMDKKTGKYTSFVKDGKELPFEQPLEEIFGANVPGRITGLAVHDGTLAVAMEQNVVALLDAVSAELRHRFDVPAPTQIAYAPDGTLYVLSDGKVARVDTESGQVAVLPVTGFETCSALTVDNAGNILVADTGKDLQIKAFSPDGKLVYTCGRQGGRPIRGAYDPMGMREMTGIAVDHRERVWVAEHDNYPRRISLWGRDGALMRDYLGNTEYSGTGCFLHETDPTLGYVGPMEFELDKTYRRARLSRILWLPDKANGESFTIRFNDHANGYRFTSSISGRPLEYYFDIPYRNNLGYVVYMETNDRWRPVAAVTTVAAIACETDGNVHPTSAPQGEFADLDPLDGVFWNDDNGDGKVQRAECEIVKSEAPYGPIDKPNKRPQSALSLGSGWGGRPGTDFTFYASQYQRDIVSYSPIGFSADGAPRYGTKGMGTVPFQDNGDLVPVTGEHRLLVMGFKNRPNSWITCIDTQTNAIEWQYPNPYPGVHGSHQATMPAPGLLIGPLKIMGLAKANDDAGEVFVMRGNLGQDFFMTTDGLYVGALYQDGRLPRPALPTKEEQLIGVPLSQYSEGGEPFNGWFGRQSDGKFRMTNGIPGQACMITQITGLPTIRRLSMPDLDITPELLAQADKDNVARAAAQEKDKELVIKRVDPEKPGRLASKDWNLIDPITIERQGQPSTATCKLAWDDTYLYALIVVKDPSPWKNEGKDFTRLFKTGDAVDIQLCTDPEIAAKQKRRALTPADLRVVISQVDKKPVAVLMKPIDKTAPEDVHHTYHSGVTDKNFDRVQILADAQVRAGVQSDRYTVNALIPLADLGLKPTKGLTLSGDVGFILSDEDGAINTARVYWSNKDTNLVNDEPMESWLYPNTWRPIRFE